MKPLKIKNRITSADNKKGDNPTHKINHILPIPVNLQYVVVILLGLCFYFNTFFNDYAFDDGLVILENPNVQNGLSGVVKIFTSGELDAIYEKYEMKEQFSGGRYRPLSIAAFAVEQAVFGPGALMKHVFNVLYYVITCILALYFLRKYIFDKMPDVAFIAAILFTIHPIHSEVVANIKSRNEIFALLFILTTMIFALRYFEKHELRWIFFGCLSLFIALLSKEYGVLMAGLLPVLFYTRQKTSILKSVGNTLPYLVPIGIYLFIKYSMMPEPNFGTSTMEPLNNQYIMAGSGEEVPTKIATIGNYLLQLLFPVNLVCDYSYFQIKFITFSHWKVWLSLTLHIFLLIWAARFILKRNIIGFFVTFYLAHLLMISNLFIEIGTTYSERLIYMASLAFCVIVAYYGVVLLYKIEIQAIRRYILIPALVMVVSLCGIRVISRNAIWKNNTTLFTHDATINKGSILLNNNAGKAYLDMALLPENMKRKEELLIKGRNQLQLANSVYPRNADGQFNLGWIYLNLNDDDSAFLAFKQSWDVRKNRPEFKTIIKYYFEKGLYLGSKSRFEEAVKYLKWASILDQNNAEIQGNLGGAYYMTGQTQLAKEAWEAALAIDSTQKDALSGYKVVKSIGTNH